VNNTLEAGISLCKEEKYTESIEILRPIAKSETTNVNAHLYLGIAYSNIQKFEEASIEFLTLTHMEPTNPLHYFNLGKVYEDSGDDLQAESAYMKALNIDQDYEKAKDRLTTLKAKPHNLAARQAQQADKQQTYDSDDVLRAVDRCKIGMAVSYFLGVGSLFLIGATDLYGSLVESIYVHPGDSTVYFLSVNRLYVALGAMMFISYLATFITEKVVLPSCVPYREKVIECVLQSQRRTIRINPVISKILGRCVLILLPLLLLMSIGTYTRITDNGMYVNGFWSFGEKYHNWTDIKSLDVDYDKKGLHGPVYNAHIVFNDESQWNYSAMGPECKKADAAVNYISQHRVYQNRQYPATSYP